MYNFILNLISVFYGINYTIQHCDIYKLNKFFAFSLKSLKKEELRIESYNTSLRTSMGVIVLHSEIFSFLELCTQKPSFLHYFTIDFSLL